MSYLSLTGLYAFERFLCKRMIRGVSSRGEEGAYAPDEIRNSIFLPLIEPWGA